MEKSYLYFLFSLRGSLYAIDALAVDVTFSLPAITQVEEAPNFIARSEERRVGKECTSWCRSRWSPYH